MNPTGRGVKRPLDSLGDPREPRDAPKRLRIQEPLGFLAAIRNAYTVIVGKFSAMASPGRQGPVQRDVLHVAKTAVFTVDDDAGSDDRSSQPDEVQYLGESFSFTTPQVPARQRPDVGEDEVKVLKEVGARPRRDAPRRSFDIKTCRGKERDREDAKPSAILRKLKELHPQQSNFARRFQFPPTKRSPQYGGGLLSKVREEFKMSGTPIRRRQRHNLIDSNLYKRDEDLAMYREACQRQVSAFQLASTPLALARSIGLNSIASPFFNRSSIAPGFVSKGQLTLEETSRRKQEMEQKFSEPQEKEVIDLAAEEDEDDLVIVKEKVLEPQRVSRPRARSEDFDVIEILEEYAPRSTQSATKPREVKRLNSLEAEFCMKDVYSDQFLSRLKEKYDVNARDRDRQILVETVKAEDGKAKAKRLEKSIEERLKKTLAITDVAIEEVIEEEDVEEDLPEITDEMETKIKWASNSRGETLVDQFSIPIARKDIDTLKGLNWLNDEIINFYLQMICERSKSVDNWPKVYAFNTFFYPKLMQNGHAAIKRWTRKVDIFSYDLILVPVHLGMHWCLGTMDLRKPGVYYYDSMGGDNRACLKAFLKYLEDEHKDKKKSPLDTSAYESVVVKTIPQQMNGSDCGMFTCKFAEYLSRNADISFSQADMPYFRRRMIYEIVSNKLLHP